MDILAAVTKKTNANNNLTVETGAANNTVINFKQRDSCSDTDSGISGDSEQQFYASNNNNSLQQDSARPTSNLTRRLIVPPADMQVTRPLLPVTNRKQPLLPPPKPPPKPITNKSNFNNPPQSIMASHLKPTISNQNSPSGQSTSSSSNQSMISSNQSNPNNKKSMRVRFADEVEESNIDSDLSMTNNNMDQQSINHASNYHSIRRSDKASLATQLKLQLNGVNHPGQEGSPPPDDPTPTTSGGYSEGVADCFSENLEKDLTPCSTNAYYYTLDSENENHQQNEQWPIPLDQTRVPPSYDAAVRRIRTMRNESPISDRPCRSRSLNRLGSEEPISQSINTNQSIHFNRNPQSQTLQRQSTSKIPQSCLKQSKNGRIRMKAALSMDNLHEQVNGDWSQAARLANQQSPVAHVQAPPPQQPAPIIWLEQESSKTRFPRSSSAHSSLSSTSGHQRLLNNNLNQNISIMNHNPNSQMMTRLQRLTRGRNAASQSPADGNRRPRHVQFAPTTVIEEPLPSFYTQDRLHGLQNDRLVHSRVLSMDNKGIHVLQLHKPDDGPFGFFIATGLNGKKKGIFISRVSLTCLVTVMQVGDELLEVNGDTVKNKTLQQVQQMISQKASVTLKIRPVVRK